MTLKTINTNKIIQDKNWTLFLDRDGVINRRLIDDYVKSISEFSFIDKVPESIAILSQIFNRVFIVTNQQGIGKGLMTEKDLEEINEHFLDIIKSKDGRIDKVYHCPNLAKENPECRKPKTGMAMQAKHDFPEINFNKSIMVGDSLSDMKFAKNAGMISVAVGDELSETDDKYIDFKFKNLAYFAQEFKKFI